MCRGKAFQLCHECIVHLHQNMAADVVIGLERLSELWKQVLRNHDAQGIHVNGLHLLPSNLNFS